MSASTLAGTAAGAGADELPPAPVSIRPMTWSTLITSFSLKSFLVRIPATGEGMSLSTLSVAIVKIDSSMAMASPSFLSHCVMVASATDSPILGIVNSNMVDSGCAANLGQRSSAQQGKNVNICLPTVCIASVGLTIPIWLPAGGHMAHYSWF